VLAAGGDVPPVFEPAEAIFNLVTLFVESLIAIVPDFPGLFRRNAGLDTPSDQIFPEPIAAVAPAAGQGLGGRQRIQDKPDSFVILICPGAEAGS
jgi:hypothetical protein